MKTRFKIVDYDDKLSFQIGINSEYEDNYLLQSWQIDDTWGIVAVYSSIQTAVETLRPCYCVGSPLSEAEMTTLHQSRFVRSFGVPLPSDIDRLAREIFPEVYQIPVDASLDERETVLRQLTARLKAEAAKYVNEGRARLLEDDKTEQTRSTGTPEDTFGAY